MKETDSKLVVVLSRNYSAALSAIRSIGAAGYTVDFVASVAKGGNSAFAAASKYVRNAYEVVEKKGKQDDHSALIQQLVACAESCDYKCVLYPTDDFSTGVVDENRELLAEHFLLPVTLGCETIEGADGEDFEIIEGVSFVDDDFIEEEPEDYGPVVDEDVEESDNNADAFVMEDEEEEESPELADEEDLEFDEVETQGKIGSCMSGLFQRSAARSAGITVPHKWILSVQDRITLPGNLTYPCVCRPWGERTGQPKKKVNIRKMRVICRDVDELKIFLIRCRSEFARSAALVEEYYKGGTELHISGVCLDQQVVAPAVVQVTRTSRFEKGVTQCGIAESFENYGDLQRQIVEMMKKYHFIGLFDVKLNISDDKVIFKKVKLQSGEPNYSLFISGVNLPALYVKYFYGEEISPEMTVSTVSGKSFVSEKVVWDNYLHGYLSAATRDERIAEADIKLLNSEDDPAPARTYISAAEKTAAENEKAIRRKRMTAPLRKIKRRVVGVLRKIKYHLLGYPQMKAENKRNRRSELPRVIVCGRNYCSNLCMARSVGKAGYEVEVLRIFQRKPKLANLMAILKPDAYSKYVKAYHVCVSNRKSIRIVNRLKKLADPRRKMLLIPTDDLVASTVDEYYKELRKYYVMPNVGRKAGEINRMMNKETQNILAEAAGLPVINSCLIQTVNGQFDIPDTVKYPCFIKPNVSKNGLKTKMRRLDSEEELRAVLTEYSQKKDVEMIVEDFIEIGRECSILGLSTKDGVVAPGFFGAEQGGHEGRRGVAMTGRVIPVSQYQELVDNVIKFVESLDYEGLFDIDLIEAVDGTMYFVEMNMRFGGSGYSITASGVNLPGMFADYMLKGTPVDLDCRIEEHGKQFISEKIAIEEYTGKFITMKGLKKGIADADIHFIKDDEDQRPFRHFKRFYTVAWLMKHVYAIQAKRKERAALKNQG